MLSSVRLKPGGQTQQPPPLSVLPVLSTASQTANSPYCIQFCGTNLTESTILVPTFEAGRKLSESDPCNTLTRPDKTGSPTLSSVVVSLLPEYCNTTITTTVINKTPQHIATPMSNGSGGGRTFDIIYNILIYNLSFVQKNFLQKVRSKS